MLITIIITILSIILLLLYVIGLILFIVLSGRELNKTLDVLVIIFYPITFWFIK